METGFKILLNIAVFVFWSFVVWVGIVFAVLILRHWPEKNKNPLYINAKDYADAISDRSVSDRRIKKMAPHVLRHSIEDVQIINTAMMEHRHHLLGFSQSHDHNPTF